MRTWVALKSPELTARSMDDPSSHAFLAAAALPDLASREARDEFVHVTEA
jgi:hypothetical protein